MRLPGPSENPLAEDLDHVLAHTRDLWEAARGQTFFVTGGTGFFGRWLLESFAHVNRVLDLCAQMVVLSRNPAAFGAKAPHLNARAGIKFVHGDVRNLKAADVQSQLGGNEALRCSFVIHAATEASARLNAENPLLMVDTIVQGTRSTMEFAVAVGARRFLVTSSGAIYGRQPGEMTHIPEEYGGGPDCTDQGAAYAEGKRLAELTCACFANQHRIEVVIARCFAFVGPFLPLDAHFAVGNFIRDAIARRVISVAGDGTPYRSYLYASDLAIWLWTILFKGAAMRPYNVGSEAALNIRQIAETVAAATGSKAGVVVARQPTQGIPPSRYVPSTARARAELGLREHVELAEGIRRTASFARTCGRAEQ